MSEEKRFRVAFSFAGEKRDFVKKVADILAETFGKEKILYDKYHQPEFSRPDLGLSYLPDLYHDETDLVVTVFCPDYEKKEWCGLEWRAIFDLIKKRRDEDVMLTRFEFVEPKGLYSIGGYLELQGETPETTATAILERLANNEGRPPEYYTKPAPQPIVAVAEDSPFFNIPYNSKGDEYVGRKGKTDEIWDLLNKAGSAAIGQAVSVKGFGGLGKTQLAVEYAHAFKDKYLNGVYWLIADENIDNQLVQIGDELGWTNQFDKTVNQLDVAKDRFLNLTECLIIFDNVGAETDIKSYLSKLEKSKHILITSRERQGSFRQIDLDLLGRDESRELLLKISGREPTTEAETKALSEILETLGGIPLAIELVGGYLHEHESVSYAAYQGYLDKVPLNKLEQEFQTCSFTDHDHSIIRTLRISEKTISEKPLMVEILKVLAWSASSPMTTSLLRTLLGDEDDFQFETALGDAHKLRLIRKEDETDRYAIHRLLAKVIRHENPIDEQRDWAEGVVDNLVSWGMEKRNDFSQLAETEAALDNIVEWRTNIGSFLPLQATRLLVIESSPYGHRGNYVKSLEALQAALSAYDNASLSDLDLSGLIQNDLGIAYGELGDHKKALEYQERSLDLTRELFGEKHPYTATSYNNVGMTYGDLGDHKKALEYQERSLDLTRELFGEKHPSTATSYNNVGMTYGDLGDHKKALEYKERSLELRRELFGEKHPSTATSYNNVGSTYGELGDHKKALEYKERSLELRRELFGEKHPSTATSYNNVGMTYGDLGDHKKALEYKERALTIFREVIGDSHPNTIIVCQNVVLTMIGSQLGERAGRLADEFLKHVPPDSPYRPFFEQHGSLYRKSKKKKERKFVDPDDR